jgi:predicted dehydrogenase
MVDPVRIGIVGCGSVSHKYVEQIQHLTSRGEAIFVAACDVEAAKRTFVERQWAVRFVTDYRELISSGDVDLVLVLTPMPLHGEIARTALRAGKHVLVEKPMSVTVDEGRETLRVAQESPGLLVCAPHVVLSPTLKEIARRLKAGDIGRVLSARARYGWAGPDWGQWFYRQGGGCLFDLGVYNITSLTALLGPAKRVVAMTGTAIPERRVDGRMMRVEAEDTAHVLLDFGLCTFAHVLTGFTMQSYRSPAIELYGTDGTIQMLGDDWAPRGYEVYRNSTQEWSRVEEPDPEWPWTDGLRHMVRCIREGRSPLVTPEHAFHVLEIMQLAKESGADGSARELSSAFAPGDYSWA